jgi:2-dehydro-3-deoxyphosphogluconate aldolase/(4S)-4-hydroxy-2-oxoglutarate aldolase
LPNVDCIGGSWIAPTDAMDAEDWARITDLCKVALSPL